MFYFLGQVLESDIWFSSGVKWRAQLEYCLSNSGSKGNDLIVSLEKKDKEELMELLTKWIIK